MKVFYFTATGNSLYVAKSLSKEYVSIVGIKDQSFDEDVIGFVFPTWAYKAPKICYKFLDNNNFKAKYFFVIATCGTSPGNSIGKLRKYFKKRNIHIDYENKVKMFDNFMMTFDFKKQYKILKEKNIEGQIEQIKNDINAKKTRVQKRFFLKTLFFNIPALCFNSLKGSVDKSFYVDENKCTKCQVCTKVCPVKNIALINNKICFKHNCMLCTACINNCPSKAIHNKFEKDKNLRFRNENVSLKEIIDANNKS